MIAQAIILVRVAVSVMCVPNKLTPKICFCSWIAILLLLLWTDAAKNICFFIVQYFDSRKPRGGL